MKYEAYFPWGFERVPERVIPIGVSPFYEDNAELRSWYQETLRNGRQARVIHHGPAIETDEIWFSPLAQVFP